MDTIKKENLIEILAPLNFWGKEQETGIMRQKIKKTIVEIKCLKHKYPDKTEVSVCGLDFVVNEGEKIVLIGQNGSGKTTLFLHLLGLLKPAEGMVRVFDLDPAKEFSRIGRKIGMVFQNVEDQLIGPTVFDDIAFSLFNYGFPKKEIEERVEDIMKRLKISHLKDKIIHYLSGGEKRKVAIAGALVLKPELLILDESLAEIDLETKGLILETLNEFNQKYKMAIVMTTNELDLIQNFSDIVYLLERGKGITFKGTYEELIKSQKKHFLCRH